MAITKERKEELVAEYVDMLRNSHGVVVTEYRGMKMGQLDALRALVRRGDREGFRVIVISHGSQFSSWTRNPALRDGVGMVGVACVLNLLGGGWQATAAGIPAQCVLLDGCGCRAHWDAAGVPTAIDAGELARILRTDPAAAAETRAA